VTIFVTASRYTQDILKHENETANHPKGWDAKQAG